MQNKVFPLNLVLNYVRCQSQWPRGLRCRSAAARLLRLWVRIPPGACCECCVYRALRWIDHSSRGVLATLVRCCVWSRNQVNEEALGNWGSVAPKTNKQMWVYNFTKVPIASASVQAVGYCSTPVALYCTQLNLLQCNQYSTTCAVWHNCSMSNATLSFLYRWSVN